MDVKDISLEDCFYLGKRGIFAHDPAKLSGPKRVQYFDPKGKMGEYEKYGPKIDTADFTDEQFAAYIKGYQDAYEFHTERYKIWLERKAARKGKPWKKEFRV